MSHRTTVPIRANRISDEHHPHREPICRECGGFNRESVGAFYGPVRCSRCKLIWPGAEVNDCLKVRKSHS